MSGLVSGLQNQLGRFDSATHLYKKDTDDWPYPSFSFPNPDIKTRGTTARTNDKLRFVPIHFKITVRKLHISTKISNFALSKRIKDKSFMHK